MQMTDKLRLDRIGRAILIIHSQGVLMAGCGQTHSLSWSKLLLRLSPLVPLLKVPLTRTPSSSNTVSPISNSNMILQSNMTEDL